MPLYDYHCRACDHTFSALVLSSSTPEGEIECTRCQEHQAEKLLSMKAAILGGAGAAASSSGYSAPVGSGFA